MLALSPTCGIMALQHKISVSPQVEVIGGCHCACGLTSTESISVAEPAPVVGTAVVTHAASPSSPDGSVDLSVSGGTPPYSFLWSNGID